MRNWKWWKTEPDVSHFNSPFECERTIASFDWISSKSSLNVVSIRFFKISDCTTVVFVERLPQFTEYNEEKKIHLRDEGKYVIAFHWYVQWLFRIASWPFEFLLNLCFALYLFQVVLGRHRVDWVPRKGASICYHNIAIAICIRNGENTKYDTSSTGFQVMFYWRIAKVRRCKGVVALHPFVDCASPLLVKSFLIFHLEHSNLCNTFISKSF